LIVAKEENKRLNEAMDSILEVLNIECLYFSVWYR